MAAGVNITDRAAEKIKEILTAEKREGQGLRLKVVGGGCSGLQYKLDFDAQRTGDRVFEKPGGAKTAASPVDPKKHQLFRSIADRKLSGVCGGIAEYFVIDPTLVRILWVVGTLITQVLPGIIIYIAMAYIVPDKPIIQEKTS